MWTCSSSSVPVYVLLVVCSACPGWISCVSFNNDFAAEIPGGIEHARTVSEETGCQLISEVIPESNVYQLRCHHVHRRSTEPHTEAHQEIDSHQHVVWTEQQQVKSRSKRQGLWGQPQPWRMPHRKKQEQILYPDAPYNDPLHFTDEKWPLMWYLNRGDRMDMNVLEAWESGVTGKGVVITILDDGIERANPDLVENYDPQASFDVNDNDGDPTPRYDLIDSNRHGTRCAGEVSASANNSVCGVGVAYNSKIGGVRMLDGDVTDAVEARAISLNNQHVDIYSASWGPDDDGKTVDGPGLLATRAFLQGIQTGRGGKGSIFVWASGNGGRDHDNCNCDGYTNSIWTLSVSSATENGLIPWYSEACSSTMASTYSSGSSGERKVVTTDLHNLCTVSHTGTSASAPMAAGVIALVLEANPSLTWRDVQHITVRNAHVANLRATDWKVNAMGRNYSHSFGYGIMDASAMVRMAKIWKTAPKQETFSVQASINPVVIPAQSSRTAKMEVTQYGDINHLEHVQAKITLTSTRRGDVQLYLVSPGGTKSQLLARRPGDSSRAGFQGWPFLTVFCWGEHPAGTWQLEVQNDGRYQVELHQWSLTFFGTTEDPFPQQQMETPSPPSPNRLPEPVPVPVQPSAEIPAVVQAAEPVPQEPQVMSLPEVSQGNPGQQQLAPASSASSRLAHCTIQTDGSFCITCEAGFFSLAGACVTSCPPEGYFKGKANNSDHCLACYYSCRTCTGLNDYQCTTCYGDAQLQEEKGGEKYCHNKSLLFQVFSSSRWYYVLSLGFGINLILVITLLCYIYKRKKASSGSLFGRKSYGRYNPVGSSGPSKSNSAYQDCETSDEERFIKPYSDNPKNSSYTDDN